MIGLPEAVPLWAAIPVSLLLVLAGILGLVGTFGLVRLSNFYQRLHGPAMLNTLGAGSVLIASMLYFSVLQTRPVVHELLITIFVLLTAPVTTMLVIKAALFRDRRASRGDVPEDPTLAGGRVTGQREE
ncbi:MAG TPA: monovalent cation/H(+) antiporter subunit G [Burkholderiaceae bacterium]|nr:monovalent cation/H(+) antiporter subunit G [Burkholderiaceae bacterium]